MIPNKVLMTLISFIVIFFCNGADYRLEIMSAPDLGMSGDPFDDKLLKMWTAIDVLRAINIPNQEKLAFLDSFVAQALDIYQEAHAACAQEHTRDLLHATLAAFDDLYDMLVADQIGFVRVMFNITNELLHQKQEDRPPYW